MIKRAHENFFADFSYLYSYFIDNKTCNKIWYRFTYSVFYGSFIFLLKMFLLNKIYLFYDSNPCEVQCTDYIPSSDVSL